MKTTGIWMLKTVDEQVVGFYHDHNDKISPLDRIPDFDGGECWIIDAPLEAYPTFPRDDSFVMVPKDKVATVWFEPYTEKTKPVAVGKVKSTKHILGK